MPRTNINYSNTIIYKLCCRDLSITEIYVGHTTDMRKRKWGHKATCNNENKKDYNNKVYTFIRENGGWDNWDMIEIERFEAIDSNDARKRERYYIENLKATLNSEIPSRTIKEWRKDNKEIISQKDKIKYEKNKDIISEKGKEYRKNNKDILIERKKKYYENNKHIINERKKEKVICECGCEICKDGLNRHMKSKKHIDLMSYPILSSSTTLTVIDCLAINVI